jgi:hypothetical protein
MDYGQDRWICKTCGRRNPIGVASDESGNCERCTDAASLKRTGMADDAAMREESSVFPLGPGGEEFLRRKVVDRLRKKYARARELVGSGQPDLQPHAHLDWVLGTRRNPGRDDARFDLGVCQLVVLWLEDFLLELDGPVLAPRAEKSVGSLTPAGDSRLVAARALRSATRDFADAFLGIAAQPVRL